MALKTQKFYPPLVECIKFYLLEPSLVVFSRLFPDAPDGKPDVSDVPGVHRCLHLHLRQSKLRLRASIYSWGHLSIDAANYF